MNEKQLRQCIVNGFFNSSCGGYTVAQIQDVTNKIIEEAVTSGFITIEDRCSFVSGLDNAQCIQPLKHLGAHTFDTGLEV